MAPKNTAAATEATEAAAPKAAAFTILSINTAVAMPENISKRRGSQTKFPFADLPVGGSFGLIGRNAKSLSSIVSAQNRHKDNQAPKLDANGAPVFKTTEVVNQDGTKSKIPTTEIETVWIKEFVAVDTDPATDPEGATVRVFRRK